VCFHGQRGEAVARAFQQRSHVSAVGGDGRPQRLFLRGIEQQASILRAFFPSRAEKAFPVLNLGCRPGGEPFGAAGAMKG